MEKDLPPSYSSLFPKDSLFASNITTPTSAEQCEFKALLRSNSVFNFRVGVDNQTGLNKIIEIRGSENQILMSVFHSPIIMDLNEMTPVTAKVIISNSESTPEFWTMYQNNGLAPVPFIVDKEERQLGIIEKQGRILTDYDYRAKNKKGKMLFKTVNKYSRMNFISNQGSVIAVATNPETQVGKDFSLKFLSAVDGDTKLLAIVLTHYMNVHLKQPKSKFRIMIKLFFLVAYFILLGSVIALLIAYS